MTNQLLNTPVPVIRTPKEMRAWTRDRHVEGKVVGCVPTMGALHEGHLSLVSKCASECDETILTIFVNPLQFGPSEDLDKYPRNEASDLIMGTEAGATVGYCPSLNAMYYPDRSIYVDEDKLSKVMCGLSRPTHFRGVMTVVAKLFNACMPDKAYFGEKDYQQLLIIKRLVRDLDFPVEIISCPIVREPDGLAMSSRNRYLTPDERVHAVCLKQALDVVKAAFDKGETRVSNLEWIAMQIIENNRLARKDYIDCRDAADLSEIKTIERPAVFALAVYIGSTRLIDNMILAPEKDG